MDKIQIGVIISGYFWMSGIAGFALFMAIHYRAERDAERQRKEVYFNLLCKKFGYSGIVTGSKK